MDGVKLAKSQGVKMELHLVGDALAKPGDKETKEKIFKSVRSLGLEDIVRSYPFLEFKELLGMALNCHVLAAPSVTAASGDSEGTPFILQQMMATGMPCLSTHHSDIPYIFGAQKKLLIPERDARAIADRFQLYFENPDAMIQDGQALHTQILKEFDVRICAARLQNIYAHIEQ